MKLIATDLDGTLLNELGKVSTENAQAIKNALDQGIQVVVATGRAYEAAYLPLQEVGLSLPIICLNGAMTYTENKELLKHIPMERDRSEEHTSELQSRGHLVCRLLLEKKKTIMSSETQVVTQERYC